MKISIYEKWFYSYHDGDKNIERVCRYCKSKSEAEEYVNNLTFLSCSPYLIKNIANDMFVEGGEHLNRLRQFGRSIVEKTDYQKIRNTLVHGKINILKHFLIFMQKQHLLAQNRFLSLSL